MGASIGGDQTERQADRETERQRDSESQSERMVGSTSTPPPPPPPHHLRADKAQGRAAGARQPDRTACCEGQGWEAVVMAER